MIVTGGEGRRHYVCGSYHGGGASACTNTLTVPQHLAEELLVEPVLKKLASKTVDAAVVSAQLQLRAHREVPRVARTSPELAKANARIASLEKCVAAGDMSQAEAAGALARANADREAAMRAAAGTNVVDMNEVAEEFRGWVGKLRRALGGADVSQAREALRQIGGSIVLEPHTECGARRALRADQTLDGKAIEAGKWEERYLVAKFTRQAVELPLHPVFAGEWFKTEGVVSSIGSGGVISLDSTMCRVAIAA